MQTNEMLVVWFGGFKIKEQIISYYNCVSEHGFELNSTDIAYPPPEKQLWCQLGGGAGHAQNKLELMRYWGRITGAAGCELLHRNKKMLWGFCAEERCCVAPCELAAQK